MSLQLSRGWARVLRVVDQIEADSFLRSNLKALSALLPGLIDRKNGHLALSGEMHEEGKNPVHCPVCRGCASPRELWNSEHRNAIVEFTEVADNVMPYCPHCSGPLRHDIVWFEEPLDPYVLDAAWRISDECDVMLVIGASLQVQPMAGLPWRAGYRGAKVIEINPHPAESSGYWALRIQDSAAVALPQIVSALSDSLKR